MGRVCRPVETQRAGGPETLYGRYQIGSWILAS